MELLHLPAVKQIFAVLHSVRLVGGCVRDTLCGIPVGDIDMATPLSPGQMIERFKKNRIRYIETGIKHGTLTALIGGKPYEITTLRTDIKTDGRHATVAYVDSYEQDALRRDFTINALYMDYAGTIYDYTNGRADLDAKYVRFIGNAAERIQEDYLRILRYFRFWGKLGHHTIDAQAVEACQKYASHLTSISLERKRSELFKILSEPACDKTLALMEKYHVLSFVLPHTDITSLTAFLKVYPQSSALQRLSILTQGVDVSLALSNTQKKELATLSYLVSFSNDKTQNRLLLAQSTQSLFTFQVYRSLSRLEISPDQADELLSLSRPLFPLTGKDLLSVGIPQGIIMKQALTLSYQIWADLNFPNDKKLVLNRLLTYNLDNQKE